MKIAFLTRATRAGGAERQLMVLARGLARRGHEINVLSFYDPTGEQDGVPVIGLGKSGRWDTAGFFLRLIATLRRLRPHIVHSYLPVANMLAVMVRPFVPGTRVVFGVRNADVDLARYDRLSGAAYQGERLLARYANLIICNSDAARAAVAKAGYPPARLTVIHNGIDTATFRPDAVAGQALRARLNITPSTCVVGQVGRVDPMKDHETFLVALSQLTSNRPDLRALVVGDGPAEIRDRLQAGAAALGLADRVVWTGAQQDMASVYNALDVLCLSSAFGESFPNVLGEAMACAVPCVATNLGDVPAIIAGTGRVVRRRDANALAAALAEMIDMPTDDRRALGDRARARIEDRFGLDRMVVETEAALASLFKRRG